MRARDFPALSFACLSTWHGLCLYRLKSAFSVVQTGREKSDPGDLVGSPRGSFGESRKMINNDRNQLRSAVIAAGLAAALGAALSPQQAMAADLGGNCCADLEERTAELEATTARKGNRKVSLEIYGQVNQGVLWWDDGGESNVSVYTNDNSRTRFGFRGKAKISSDWEAGYRLEIGVRTQNSKRFTQDNPSGAPDTGLDLRDSYWYVKNKSLGTVAVGRQATSTDQITEINLTQTKDFAKYSDVEDTGLG